MILKKLIFCVLFLLTFTFETFSMDKITQQDLRFNEREKLYLKWIFEENNIKLDKSDLRKSTDKLLEKYKNFDLNDSHIDINKILLTILKQTDQTFAEGFLNLNGYSHDFIYFKTKKDVREIWINRSQIFYKKNNSIKVINLNNYKMPTTIKLFSDDTSYFSFVEDIDGDKKPELNLGSNASIIFSRKFKKSSYLDKLSYPFRPISIFKNNKVSYLIKFESDKFKIFDINQNNIKTKLINGIKVFDIQQIKPILERKHNTKLSVNEYLKKINFSNGKKKLYFTELNEECDRDIFPLDGIQHKNKIKLTNGKLNIFDFDNKIKLTQIYLGKVRCDSIITLIPYVYKNNNNLILYLSNTNYFYILDLDKIENKNVDLDKIFYKKFFLDNNINNILGFSFTRADFNMDKIDDIILSEPAKKNNRGFVYLINGKNFLNNSKISHIVPKKIIASKELAFLGVNNITTNIDLNEDGFNEIILNAPYFSYNSLADGAIKIIDGKKLFNLIQ